MVYFAMKNEYQPCFAAIIALGLCARIGAAGIESGMIGAGSALYLQLFPVIFAMSSPRGREAIIYLYIFYIYTVIICLAIVYTN